MACLLSAAIKIVEKLRRRRDARDQEMITASLVNKPATIGGGRRDRNP